MAGSKGEMRAVDRWAAGICAGLSCALSVSACQRSVAASFVPSLQVQLRAHRARPDLLTYRNTPWDASVTAWLRFRPTIAAADIPIRAEFNADLSAIPCELEELTCLEEFAESERTIAPLMGQFE